MGSQDVVTDVVRESIMKFDIAIDAHHAGHLEMRLCPFIINGDDQDLSSCTLLQRATAAEAGVNDCTTNDDRDICASIDPNNPGWWYLAPKGPRGNVHSMWFHIPSNVNCPNDRCTVQFTWKTANSCNPHPAAYCNYYHNVVGPGLNRGVTDAACAKCADGYQWWPCNEDSLCQCSGSALVQVVPQKVLSIKRAIGSKRRGAFLAPDHAMIQMIHVER